MTAPIRFCASWLPVALELAAVLAAPSLALADEAASPADAAKPSSVAGPTHEQVKLIMPTDGDARWKLVSFCLTPDGRIATVLNRQDAPLRAKKSPGLVEAVLAVLGGAKQAGAPAAGGADKREETSPAVAEMRILDADGKLLHQWPLDFQAQAINVGPDDSFFVAGDGVLVRMDADGKQLARAESPQVEIARQDPEALKRRARETLEEQRKSMEESLKRMELQKEELAKKEDSSLTEEERQTKAQMDQNLSAYKNAIERNSKPITEQEVAQMADNIARQARTINAVAANDKFVFTTTRASKGYGFRVWRTTLDFSEPESIVDGLSGCCGQMDVQCCDDGFVVAENSRKRVVRYDAEGKMVDSWGKGSRDGEGDTFGSCCNPMNTRFAGGKLYVSDSDGRVRLFTLDGKLEAEVGKANVQPGCKSSIVDVSPDGSRVYYIDVESSRICMLQRKPDDRQASR